jgi:hypothetical protein
MANRGHSVRNDGLGGSCAGERYSVNGSLSGHRSPGTLVETTGWSISVTMPMLLKTVQSRKLDRILEAYDTFKRAASTQALKVIIGGYPI